MKNNVSSSPPPSPHSPPPTAVQTETLRNLPSPGINEGIYTVKVTPNLTLPSTEMSPRIHSLPIIGSSDSTDAPDSLSPKENILLERISQLESQLAEMSLKQRLEIRRSQLSQQAVGFLALHPGNTCTYAFVYVKLVGLLPVLTHCLVTKFTLNLNMYSSP